jgi:ubiquinone/menaquinone biosynthesis C-methylase UbiE
MNPDIGLFGIDVSKSMISRAAKNLSGIQVVLQQNNVRGIEFPGNFFDLVTCSGSFYLWDNPVEGLNEIFRVLKNGASAFLYECNHDCNRKELRLALKNNLRKLNLVSRIVGPPAIRQAIMAAYTKDDIRKIVLQSFFGNNFLIGDKTISGLPAWFCIELRKAN